MNYPHAAVAAQAGEITAQRAAPSPLREEEESEGLHWALRASFVALVSPRAWLDALFPERVTANK